MQKIQSTRDNSSGVLIHKLFEEQVRKTPDYIALECNENILTYKELNDRANSLAWVLRDKGVKSGSIVGIMVHRSFSMVVGILGILKAGGAFLPLDPHYPENRLNYILNDSGAKLLLTEKGRSDKIINNFKGEEICIDDMSLYAGDCHNLESINHLSDLCYLIYTSGSTGEPKGVMIEHKSVYNFISGITDIIDFSEKKSILALTTMSFDIFVLETLLPLSKGLRVIIGGEKYQRNPKLLSELIIKHNIDMIQMTPSAINLLLMHYKSTLCFRGLKEIMIGGEVLSESLLNKLKNLTSAKIYNLYGPTETTVWSTVSNLTSKDTIDIGKPILNTQIYILNENQELQPKGAKGELYIGGHGLARGYYNKPDLTSDRFIYSRFLPGERIYKTGDLAVLLPDDNIKYIGRVDSQVKIRGHRVELEEVECHLKKLECFEDVVVAAKNRDEEEKYLCAYYIANKEILLTDVHKYLEKNLPDYMIPSQFIRIGEIPLTPNGKVDRDALTSFHFANNYFDKVDEKKSDNDNIETRVRRLLIENLNLDASIDSISLEDPLSKMGLDSISFIKLIVSIENEFGFEFGDEDLDLQKLQNLQNLVLFIKNKTSKKLDVNHQIEDNSIETRVRRLLIENLNLDASIDSISLEDPLSKMGLDSISFIKLIVSIENEFGFEFGDEDLNFQKLQSLQNIISFIANKTGVR